MGCRTDHALPDLDLRVVKEKSIHHVYPVPRCAPIHIPVHTSNHSLLPSPPPTPLDKGEFLHDTRIPRTMPRAFVQPPKPRHLQNHILAPVQSLPLRSLFRENATIIGKFIAGILLFLPFWIAFGVCIGVGNCIGSVRAMLASTRIPQPDTADLLSALDSLWLSLPGDKSPNSIAHIVMKLGDDIGMKDFVDMLTNRLVNVKNPRPPPPYLYTRFRQRLYPIPGTSRSVFAFSPRFDVANHIHQMPSDVDTDEKLQAFAATLSANPFEMEKPLWDMHIRTDFGPQKCGILLFRFHQAITDGQSMVQALCRDILDRGDQIWPQIRPRFGGLTYAGHFCKAVFMSGYIFLTDLISPGAADLNLLKHPDLKLSGKHEIFWSEPVNLSVIQRLKSITRCRFNDILFTALAATLRTYCKMHGVSTPADMTACFPVDLRSRGNGGINDLVLGNRFVLDKIRLPVSQEAGMPQLWRVRDQTQQMRRGYRHVALDFLLKMMQKALSTRMMHRLWNGHFSGCTLLVNSLAGPEGVLTIQDFALEQLLMWIPPPPGMGFPFTINFVTSLDAVQLVVVADTGALSDAYWLAMDFPHEMMALGNLLKTRRVPEHAAKGEAAAAPDADAEKAVQQSLGVLEGHLVKVQMAVRKMRKRHEGMLAVPALWNNFHIVLPPEKESVSTECSSSYDSDSNSSDYSSSDDDSDSDSDSDSNEDDEEDDEEGEEEEEEDALKEGATLAAKASKEADATAASGDASLSKKAKVQVVKVKVKSAENSDISLPVAAAPPRPSAPPGFATTVEQVDETRNLPDRRMAGSPGAAKLERRLSAKPTLFSAMGAMAPTNTTMVYIADNDHAPRQPVLPGQISKRRMSQAAAVIPTIVPAANRRISRS